VTRLGICGYRSRDRHYHWTPLRNVRAIAAVSAPVVHMPENRSKTAAFGSGAVIGALGGLIGLGGAEFRLPLLISLFRFRGLEAVILNILLPLLAAVLVISAVRVWRHQ